MFFPPSTLLTDLGFLLMRLMVGAVFITSCWSDFRNPDARSKSIGMSKGFTILLGASEVHIRRRASRA
jgi:putative oxidoreductase